MAKRRQADSAESAGGSDPGQPTFEEALARLEEIAEQLEEGHLGLGESLASYEEGVRHLKLCHELLTRAERKVELLSGIDAEGNPITQPFDDTASSLDETAQNRGPRRSRAANSPAPPKPEREARDVDDEDLLF